MARYPTFEEYEKGGNFKDGIKRCDDLLRKNPNDVELLTVKLQLLYATKIDGAPVLEQLLSIQPPIQDLRELVAIEEAVVASQSGVYPQPKTAGPAVAKLWDNAAKASNSVNHKLDILSLRFSRAIVNNRLVDAQQALIQLKALQPKNRVTYMAHAAVTQLLSTSKDDLSSRLSLSLARKAVKESFDEDKSLDCRVPGQIFAIQGSSKDLEGIANRPFKESKHVYDALQKDKKHEVNGVVTVDETKDPSKAPPDEWLHSEVHSLKQKFAELIESSASSESVVPSAANAIRLFHTATTVLVNDRRRVKVDACFLSISALVRLFEQTNGITHLLQAAYLVETLLQKNPHIHEARLILVYLYMRLRLGSLALSFFQSLNVKEIQHDTVGHALFTRLPFTYPVSSVPLGKKSPSPLERLSQALTTYTRCEEKLAENEASVLSHEQTGMIFDLQELRDKLRSSLSRRIIHLEQRRLVRLSNLKDHHEDHMSGLGPKMSLNWLETTDNRDFAATFNYGYDVEKVLHSYAGTPPRRNYVLHALITDSAWCLAMGLPTPVNDPEKLLEELTNTPLDIEHLNLNDNWTSLPELAHAEYLAADLACQVLKMLPNLKTGHAESAINLEAVQKGVERLNIGALVDTADALTDRLLDHYAYLDVLRIVVKACASVNGQTKECAEEVKKIERLAKDAYSRIQNHAKEQMKRIRAADVVALVKQDESIWEAIKLFGDDSVKPFCEAVAESAKAGWEGVTKITLV